MDKGKQQPGSASESSPVALGGLLNELADVLSKLMIDSTQAQFAASDLTLLQAQVLRVLATGPLPTGKLAIELRVSASAVTQLTDRLIRKELIERQAGVTDRRAILVRLSPKGKRLVEGFRKRRMRLFAEALELLDQREQVTVLDGIKLFITAVERYREKHEPGKAIRSIT
jgi:DNA-binding MarR family transcriptional regulator